MGNLSHFRVWARVAGRNSAVILSFLVVALPLLTFLYLTSWRAYNISQRPPDTVHNVAWTEDEESRGFVMLARFAVISGAALFGSVGAVVSAISRFHAGDRSQLSRLVAAQWIGAVFAIVLMLVFAGGLIQGGLFPGGGVKGEFFGIAYMHVDLAKLFVWSFIAGFSERLVPRLLNSLTEKLRLEVTETRHGDEGKSPGHPPGRVLTITKEVEDR